MRPLEKMTFEAMIKKLRVRFNGLQREGAEGNYEYDLSDILMSGEALFFFQDPSLLAFQERMQKKFERTNLESIFGVKRVPKESQMRERLDQVKWTGVRLLLPQIFEQVRRRGWLIEWRNEIRTGREKGFYYVVAIDGSDYFSSEKVSCENCLRRENRAGEINYRHTVVAGTLVKADKREILPMAVEMCERQDGSQKQDCEVAAGKRLIRRMRAEHPHLAMVVTGVIYIQEFLLWRNVSNKDSIMCWSPRKNRSRNCLHGSQN